MDGIVPPVPHAVKQRLHQGRTGVLGSRQRSSSSSPHCSPLWLIHAWQRQTDEHKYFISNAPLHTPVEILLRVAFNRARVEHLFRLAKTEWGHATFEAFHRAGRLVASAVSGYSLTTIAQTRILAD